MAKSSYLRKSIYIIILLFIILMLAILFGAFRTSSIGPDLDKPLTSEEVAKLLPRGQEHKHAFGVSIAAKPLYF
ncbi:hypothetical protein AB7293_19425 [Providencia huaxiensis]|uniref:hypothetical protein n=1 Tax=Providencia huaxiensis TaxID=2027290 RepID=UPI0034E39B25